MLLLTLTLLLTGCLSAPDRFVDGRSALLCDQAFPSCGRTAGCRLDDAHYLSGRFPGARRLLIDTPDDDAEVRLRLFFTEMEAPGTELLAQLYDPDCVVGPAEGQHHIADSDLFVEIGDDRALEIDLTGGVAGEQLLELYSDASVHYLLTVDFWE